MLFQRKARFFIRSAFFTGAVLFFSGCSLFNKPEDVIGEMIENMSNVQNMHTSSDIKFVSGDTATDENVQMSATIESDINASNPESLKTGSTFTYQTSFSNINFDIQGETRTIDAISYLKFNELPGLGILGGFKNLTGQWYKLDPAELADSSLLANVDSLALGNLSDPTSLYGNVTPEQKEDLRTLASETSFFTLKEKLDDTEIGSVKTYHYKVNLNTEALLHYFVEADKIVGYSASQVNTNADGSADENSAQQIAEIAKNVEASDIDLYIGKKDSFLYKASGTLNFSDDAVDSSSPLASLITPTIDFTFTFSDFGKEINIEVPEGAKSFEEFINESVGSLNLGGL